MAAAARLAGRRAVGTSCLTGRRAVPVLGGAQLVPAVRALVQVGVRCLAVASGAESDEEEKPPSDLPDLDETCNATFLRKCGLSTRISITFPFLSFPLSGHSLPSQYSYKCWYSIFQIGMAERIVYSRDEQYFRRPYFHSLACSLSGGVSCAEAQ